MSVTGAWRIVEMDLWDSEAIDLLGPGFIQFGADQTGHFRFIAVEGWMDCRNGRRDGRPCVEFTWEGNDESDPASGRGWAAGGACPGCSRARAESCPRGLRRAQQTVEVVSPRPRRCQWLRKGFSTRTPA